MNQRSKATTIHASQLPVDSLVNSIENLYFAISGSIILCLVSSLPISKLCIGVIYLHQCPIQEQIPKWLIVSGCRGLFCILIVFIIVCIPSLINK
jgi:hypothetical protein